MQRRARHPRPGSGCGCMRLRKAPASPAAARQPRARPPPPPRAAAPRTSHQGTRLLRIRQWALGKGKQGKQGELVLAVTLQADH